MRIAASPAEIQRLADDAAAWLPCAEALFDRLGIGPGMRCLELGAGIGMVSLALSQRVGSSGSVTAVEKSPLYAETLREQLARKDIVNVEVVVARPDRFAPKKAAFDLIYAWQMDVTKAHAAGLRRGGVLAVQTFEGAGFSAPSAMTRAGLRVETAVTARAAVPGEPLWRWAETRYKKAKGSTLFVAPVLLDAAGRRP